MIHIGNAITVRMLQNGIAEFHFHSQEHFVNKFDHATLTDFKAALDAVDTQKNIQGLIITFSKDYYSIDGDIKMYRNYSSEAKATIHQQLHEINTLLKRLETLPFPTIITLEDHCVGSNFDIALACDYRVITAHTKFGFLTTPLGILPPFGGMTRLTRLIGLETATRFFTTAITATAKEALACGLANAIVDDEQLLASALHLIQQDYSDWKKIREEKSGALLLSSIEQFIALEAIKRDAFSEISLVKNPNTILLFNTLKDSIILPQKEALEKETAYFIEVIQRPQTDALIHSFQIDQFSKAQMVKYTNKATPIMYTAILGTNETANKIAQDIAIHNKSVSLRVNTSEQAEQCMQSIRDRLYKQFNEEKASMHSIGDALCRIHPTYHHETVAKVDFVIETLDQHPKSKVQAIKDIESHIVTKDTIIASNTSHISITQIAKTLQRSTQFIGMHFLEEIAKNQLVEVIYGEETSQGTIATSMTFAQDLGKTAILIKDSAGFFVYRTLLPYLNAFETLIADGSDFQKIDHIMENFGWSIGPAGLIDLLGTDQFINMANILSERYPERIPYQSHGAISKLHHAERFGRQNHLGFYQYKTNNHRSIDGAVYDLLEPIMPSERQTFSHHEIIDRLLLPLCNEAVRCIEEKIISTAYEVDLAINLIGFPSNTGGPCHYIEQIGIKEYIALCNSYAHLGPMYEAPQILHTLATQKQSLFHTGAQ